MIYYIKSKFYSKKDNLFYVIFESRFNPNKTKQKVIKKFKKFYRVIKKDLTGVDLTECDFNGIDLKRFDFYGSKISPNIMEQINPNSLFLNCVCKNPELCKNKPSSSFDLVRTRNEITSINEDTINYNIFVFYISDLHLDYKLNNHFKYYSSDEEIVSYVKNIVLNLKKSLKNDISNMKSKVLFIGDTSYNFENFKLFFNIYRELIDNETFAILGNHELWDESLIQKHKKIDGFIKEYRDFLCDLNIQLLENELYVENGEKHIYSYDELIDMDSIEIKKIFFINSYGIFGGIGFAGKNETFNCENKIYGDAPISRILEKELSKKVEIIHHKLSEVIPDKKLFFVTHMPKNDWSNEKYVPNWFYLSGHTHKNFYKIDESAQIFADNQIGYTGTINSFKFIPIDKYFNVFDNYKDGIYEISNSDYILFNYYYGTRITFNRSEGFVICLKRENVYCFLYKNKEKLYFLNGGIIKKIKMRDVQFFYDNMLDYYKSICKYIETFDDYEKNVSNYIKSIGGNGTIHGSIVDIDWYNHLYVNPFDSTITPYFAFSKTDKNIYKNLTSLLKYKLPTIYKNQIESSYNEKSSAFLLPSLKYTSEISNRTKHDSSTYIYSVSNVILSFQFTYYNNIIKLWSEAIMNSSSDSYKKAIDNTIINLIDE